MRAAWAILGKDFASYSRSWTGVLTGFAFLLLSGIFFTIFLLGYAQLSMEAARRAYEGIEGVSLTCFIVGGFTMNLGVLFLFLTPLLAMRSLAEEKRMGTLELLYTYPLTDFQIVLGKYLALLGQLLLLYLPTLAYLVVIRMVGAKFDWGVVVAGSLGFFLLGASFLAIGLFFSSLTEHQILAASLTFIFLLGVWVLEWFTGLLPGAWGAWLAQLSPLNHYRDFSLGLIDLRDVTFFLSAIAFFFFLSLRVVETRNWKG